MSGIALCEDKLETIRASTNEAVTIPSYPRYHPERSEIVHLGLGNFVRSHLAQYVESCNEDGEGGLWTITGANLPVGDRRRDTALAEALGLQDYLYTLSTRSGQRAKDARTRVIGCIGDYVYCTGEDTRALISRLSAASVKILSLTITEKGYLHDPLTGLLLLNHPAVQHDICCPDNPQTAVGCIVAALFRRKFLGLHPFTVLSCDNIPENGTRLACLVQQMMWQQSAHRRKQQQQQQGENAINEEESEVQKEEEAQEQGPVQQEQPDEQPAHQQKEKEDEQPDEQPGQQLQQGRQQSGRQREPLPAQQQAHQREQPSLEAQDSQAQAAVASQQAGTVQARETSVVTDVCTTKCDNDQDDDDLADWIRRAVCFPNSMVDRITPETLEGDREELRARLGIIDRMMAYMLEGDGFAVDPDCIGAAQAIA